MMNHSILAVMLAAAASACCAAAPPRTAFIYSSWNNNHCNFINEFDGAFKSLGIKPEKVKNTDIPKLSDRLSNFDLVCVASTGNYDNSVNLAPYAPKWRDFIANGGMLLIVDANYPSVLKLFLNTLGPDFALSSELCSAHKLETPEAKLTAVAEHPLMTFPAPLNALIKRKSHWAHIKTPPKGWSVLESCVDGQALVLAKSFGKGLILLTAESDYSGQQDILAAIITNISANRALLADGIKVISFTKPDEPGPGAFSLILAAAPDKLNDLSLDIQVISTQSNKLLTAKPVIADGLAKFDIPVILSERGPLQFNITLKRALNIITATQCSIVIPPVISLSLKRKHLYPSSANLKLLCVFLPDKNARDNLSFQWRFDDAAWNKAVPVIDLQTDYDVNTASLPAGKHSLSVRLLHNDKVIATENTVFFKHTAPKYDFRNDGVLLENGKPFFPLGFYHVSWAQSPEHRLNMARAVAAAGFNTVHVGITSAEKDTDSYAHFLNECDKIGIRVITEFGLDSLQVINKYKSFNAVMGWNPGDEPAARGISAAEMFSRYDTFKQADPEHIAYTVICLPAQYKNYAAGTDVLAPDPYPVPSAPIETVYWKFRDAATEAANFDTTVWAVPQCFGGYDSWKRPPSPQEFRAMTYLALLSGVRGIIYYTFYDGGFNLPDSTELWNACKALPAELKELIPMLLDGNFSLHSEARGGIYAGTWSLNGKSITVIVNPSDKVAEFNFNLPNSKSAKTVFGIPLTLKTDNGLLSGSLNPLERIVIHSNP